MQLLHENILVEFVDTENEMKTDSGIYIATSYEPCKYAPIKGICLESGNPEVLEGDEVYFHYLATIRAKEENRIIDYKYSVGEDRKRKAILHKESLFFVKREGKTVFINDYVLCEKIEEKRVSELELKPGYKKNQFKVLYDGYGFEKGQHIATEVDCDVPFAHSEIMGDTDVFRVNRNNIVGVIEYV